MAYPVAPIAGFANEREALESIEAVVPAKFAEFIIGQFFLGRTPVPAGQFPVARHAHGVPGSGKTEEEWRRERQNPHASNNTVLVAYDEHGVIEQIPGWREETESITDYDALLAARDKYRLASQVLRDIVLNRAILGRYNVRIDSTSGSPGAIKLLGALNSEGYVNRVASYYAPFDICRKRFEMRRRAISMAELTDKRAGVYSTMQPLIERASRFTCYYNPDNDGPSRKAFIIEGTYVTFRNNIIMDSIINDMTMEVDHADLREVSGNAEKLAEILPILESIRSAPLPRSAPAVDLR